MKTNQINQLLTENFEEIHSWIIEDANDLWEYGPENKWSVGQHVLHLLQSNNALYKGLKIPTFIKNYKFGKRNRPPRKYDEVIAKYNEKLMAIPAGTVSPFSVNMPKVTLSQRQLMLKQFYVVTEKVKSKTLKIRDKTLDDSLLPHPLMGRMTLREILMWNAYHTKHHLKILKQKYI